MQKLIALLILGLLLAGPSATRAEPLELDWAARRLNAEQPDRESVGSLRFRGALEITSPAPDFGGLSGLLVSADGMRMTAVSDQGRWVTARLTYDDEGRLAGLGDGEIGKLESRNGVDLKWKELQDAESLALLPNGAMLVAFEHFHRIWRYPPGGRSLTQRPERLPEPPGLGAFPLNRGIEALVVLSDARILAITSYATKNEPYPVFLWQDDRWLRLSYQGTPPYEPTGAALLPDGDILVLERKFSLLGGIGARIVRLRAADIEAGALLRGREVAVLEPPLLVDNMEGIAARRGPDGETLIYLLSDDNFFVFQRTLLMMFALEEE